MPTNDIAGPEGEMVTIDETDGQVYGFARWLADLAASHDDTGHPGWLAPPRTRHRGLGDSRRYPRAVVLITAASVLMIGTFLVVNGGERVPETASDSTQVYVPTSMPDRSETTAATAIVSGTAPQRCQSGVGREVMADAAGPWVASGHQAIVAFEYAYYVARDASQARAAVASDAAVPPPEQIQAGIDSVPADTTYCVRIRALVGGQYLVELTEARPGEQETTWRQRISTAEVNGHVVITSIAATP